MEQSTRAHVVSNAIIEVLAAAALVATKVPGQSWISQRTLQIIERRDIVFKKVTGLGKAVKAWMAKPVEAYSSAKLDEPAAGVDRAAIARTLLSQGDALIEESPGYRKPE